MGSQVPSPTHVNKSQHGGRVPAFEPQEPFNSYGLCRILSNLDYSMQKKISGAVFRIASSFLLDLTLNTSPKAHLEKVLPCRHPCHTWDLGLGTPYKVVRPNVHVVNG